MSKIIIIYLISFGYFLLIDFIWLAYIAKDIYRKYLGHMIAETPNYIAAAIFYIIFMAGMNFFVIQNPQFNGSVGALVMAAAAFGLVTYATFDLTSQASFKNWSTTITLIDLTWGVFLSTSVSVATYFTVKFLF